MPGVSRFEPCYVAFYLGVVVKRYIVRPQENDVLNLLRFEQIITGTEIVTAESTVAATTSVYDAPVLTDIVPAGRI